MNWRLLACLAFLLEPWGWAQAADSQLPYTQFLLDEAIEPPPPPDEWRNHVPPNFRSQAELPSHVARACYLIPSNRAAQSNAIEKFQHNILLEQEWYREQMERNGFGAKTFEFEKEEGSDLPKIHIVNAPNPDSYYRTNTFSRVRVAAQNAGLPVMSPGQVWCIIAETHTMNSNGSIDGIYNGGSSNGSGDDPGQAVTVGLWLAMATAEYLVDDRSYDGLVEPGVGPFPMVKNVTFLSFEGATFSGVSSTAHGVVVHETAHGFGLSHDYRNDANACGNIMYNGLRGVRGWAYPDRYPNNECRLEYASALALNVSRYFNGARVYDDNVKPSVAVLTSGAVAPVGGKIEIRFTASDSGGLAAALLRKSGMTVEEMPLSGTSVDRTFATAWHDPGQSVDYTVAVYDTQGNCADASAAIVSQLGFNCAPVPFIRIKPSKALVNETVALMAGSTSDPDDAASLLAVEWDVDGDGDFDTAPTTEKTFLTAFSEPGTRLIRARITDPHGAWALSTPIGLRVESPPPNSAQDAWRRYQ